MQLLPLSIGELQGATQLPDRLDAVLYQGCYPPLHDRLLAPEKVDLVLDMGTRLIPVEIKAGQTIQADFFRSLRKWCTWAGEEAGSPVLIYGGEQEQQREDCAVLSWRNLEYLSSPTR